MAKRDEFYKWRLDCGAGKHSSRDVQFTEAGTEGEEKSKGPKVEANLLITAGSLGVIWASLLT